MLTDKFRELDDCVNGALENDEPHAASLVYTAAGNSRGIMRRDEKRVLYCARRAQPETQFPFGSMVGTTLE